MKTLPSFVRAPKIWIWTSKIMPDLWFSAVFCQIKKNHFTLVHSSSHLIAHGRGGRRSFLILAVNIIKQKHPPPGVQQVGCTLLGNNLSSSKIYMKMSSKSMSHICRAGTSLIAHSLISPNQMIDCERFAQIAQDK